MSDSTGSRRTIWMIVLVLGLLLFVAGAAAIAHVDERVGAPRYQSAGPAAVGPVSVHCDNASCSGYFILQDGPRIYGFDGRDFTPALKLSDILAFIGDSVSLVYRTDHTVHVDIPITGGISITGDAYTIVQVGQSGQSAQTHTANELTSYNTVHLLIGIGGLLAGLVLVAVSLVLWRRSGRAARAANAGLVAVSAQASVPSTPTSNQQSPDPGT